jgi:hypothetical protein
MSGVYGHLMTAITEGKHNHLYLGSATDWNNGGLVRRRDQHICRINGNGKTRLKHYSLLRQKDVKRTSSFIVLMRVPFDIEEATKEDLWAVRLLSFVGEAVYTAWLSGYDEDPQDGPALKGAAQYQDVSWYGACTHNGPRPADWQNWNSGSRSTRRGNGASVRSLRSKREKGIRY